MYRDKSLVAIAKRNGWRPGYAENEWEAITAHLPIRVLRSIEQVQPDHIVSRSYASIKERLGITDRMARSIEYDRTLVAIYPERVRQWVDPPPPPPSQCEGDDQEGEGKENTDEEEDAPDVPPVGRDEDDDGEAPPDPNEQEEEGDGNEDDEEESPPDAPPPPAPPPPSAEEYEDEDDSEDDAEDDEDEESEGDGEDSDSEDDSEGDGGGNEDPEGDEEDTDEDADSPAPNEDTGEGDETDDELEGGDDDDEEDEDAPDDEGDEDGEGEDDSDSEDEEGDEGEDEGEGEDEQPKPTAQDLIDKLNQDSQNTPKPQDYERHSAPPDGAFSTGDWETARKVRSLVDRILGSFGMERIPILSAKKVVNRMAQWLPLSDVYKEEDGRPTILLLNDMSGSCAAVSQAVTHAANSASLLGTPTSQIFSMPLSNSDYLLSYPPTFRNGQEVPFSAMYKRDENNKYEQLYEYRSIQGGRLPTPFDASGISVDSLLSPLGVTREEDVEWNSDNLLAAHYMLVSRYLGLRLDASSPSIHGDLGYDQVFESQWGYDNFRNPHRGSDKDKIVPMIRQGVRNSISHLAETEGQAEARKLRMRELVAVYGNRVYEYQIASKSDIEAKSTSISRARGMEVKKWKQETPDHNRLFSAILAGIEAEVIVYYTDSDGASAIHRILAGLKQHQRLYVFTYASFPNTVVDTKDGMKFGVMLNSTTLSKIEKSTDRNGEWLLRDREGEARAHKVAGSYMGAPTLEKHGMSVPSMAFRPQGTLDFDYLPSWFGRQTYSPYFRALASSPNCTQLTLVPNVTDVDGYLAALGIISSPERLSIALSAGRGMRREIDEHPEMWNESDHPL